MTIKIYGAPQTITKTVLQYEIYIPSNFMLIETASHFFYLNINTGEVKTIPNSGIIKQALAAFKGET